MSALFGGASPIAAEAVRVVVVLGAGLLVPAGVAKLRRPVDARDALGWRSARSLRLVQAIGVVELVLAGAVFLLGGPATSGALAFAYLAFAVVAVRQRRRGASCGCFGQTSAPAGLLHVGVNGLVALAAVLAARGVGALADFGRPLELGLGPALTLAAVVAVFAAVASVQQLLTGLPELRAATRRVTLPAPRAPRPDPAAGGGVR